MKSNMAGSVTDRLNAQATLMKAYVAKLHGFIRDHECPTSTIRRELKPFESLSPPSNLAQLVGENDLNNMFLLLPQSKLPKKEYRTLRKRITTYIADNSKISPIHWEIWRGLIIRYELVGILPIGDWVAIVAILETAFVQNPDDIAALSRLGAMEICDTFFHRGKILIIWQTFNCWCATSKQQFGPLQLLTKSTNMVAGPIKGELSRKPIFTYPTNNINRCYN